MPFNNAGVYTPPSNSFNPAVDDTDISAGDWNSTSADMATGISTMICRDGQSTVTANIPLATFKITGLGNGTAQTDAINLSQLGKFTGFISGLTLSTAGGSGTFGVAVGAAVNSTSAIFMSLASAFTKTTGAFVVGTGNGSLDTGSIANSTWYHVFLISTAAGVTDILTSLSATAPTMPSTYTLFRRIGSMKIDGSAHWFGFTQVGNEFIWTTPVASDINANITATQTAGTLNVPSGIVVLAHLTGWAQNAASTNTSFNITPVAQTGVSSASNSNPSTVQIQSGAGSIGTVQAFNIDILTNTSQQINLVATDNSASNLVRASAYGWNDARGSM